jgi:phospho-N-acetylmuramoyl-pentapeptide-transferase
MVYWWLQQSAWWGDQWARASSGDSHVFLTARTALATVSAFFLALIIGPYAITWLSSRFRERIDSASSRLNELHASKNATPTMGGLFIVAAIVLAALLFGDLTSVYIQQGLVVVVTYGLLGACDDWIKIRTHRRGLTARQKFLCQLVLGTGIVCWLMASQQASPWRTVLALPIGSATIPLGLLFVVWGVFVLVGASNGVNLTDGLDGLASGCLLFAGGAMAVLTYLAGHSVLAEYLAIPYERGVGELCILLGALIGASLGFLWFNCYPAQVFMGDTGSLPTGALLGYSALAIHQELLLAIAGGVFVIETLSVIAQVSWFRLTGRRIIACSPLHNHYLFRGQHEMKIVVRFWIAAALLALGAIGCLKIR